MHLDQGINFFDTAMAYQGGTVRRILRDVQFVRYGCQKR